MTPLVPGLMVIHGNRMEELRALAMAWMARQPLAPLENETILVQSNGVAQWLKMALAEAPARGGLGVAAALEVQLPGRFLWQAYRAVLGPEAVAPDSPYNKDVLLWRILRLLPQCAAEPAFAPLALYLQDDGDGRKHYQLAERLADLFDQYQVYRADWLHAWTAGEDHLLDVHGQSSLLPEGQAWQPLLWRALVADIGTEAASRSGVHPLFMARAAALTARPPGLPRRLIVFGISALPAQALQAFSALARFCQIMIFVLNPCRHYWADIVRDRELLRAVRRRQVPKAGMPRDLDENSLHLHAHPLLAAWGRQGRDYIRLLDEYDDPETYRHLIEGSALTPHLRRLDLFSEPDTSRLLGQLQDDVLDLRPLAETRERWPAVDAAGDDSLRFHIAHSPQREVEILHDQLLHYFDREPDLKPRDIVVMVPDIEQYAPHILAVFGQYGYDDLRHIPFTLADRRQRGREPLLLALESLLRLPESRFTAGEILDLLDVPALRARFGLTAADLPSVQRWIREAGVRWGLDPVQRASLGLPDDLEQNSWRFGLRRMLLGYAVGEGPAWREVEPYGEIGGLEAALLGPLVRLLDQLALTWQTLCQPATPEAWGQRLRALLDTYFLAEEEQETLLLAQLSSLLDAWLDACAGAGLVQALPLTVVREAWLSSLDRGGLSQRFMGGAVNFCTLMPMRAIPFRMICLLGMNDGDYPRPQPADDFDLMRKDYRPGDRSRREDDRYLFLEALLSARDRLLISWVGRSVRDNSERPPSVLVAQLRDHLAAGWRLAPEAAGDVLSALTLTHALQPFNARYFQPQDEHCFSYAGEWLGKPGQEAAACATTGPMSPLPLPEPLPPPTLALLARLLRNPVRFFFTQRLKVWFDPAEEAQTDTEPFSLERLEESGMAGALLVAALPHAGDGEGVKQALDQAGRALSRQGRLPVGESGQRHLAALCEPLPDLLERYAQALHQWPLPVALRVKFAHGEVQLDDWLTGLRQNGTGEYALILPLAQTLGAQDDLKWTRLTVPWVAHLAANAGGLPLSTLLIAQDRSLTLPPLPQPEAAQALTSLLDAWCAGLCQPLPVAMATACVSLLQDESTTRRRYEGTEQLAGEVSYCPYLSRQYPDYAALTSDGQFFHWAEKLYGALVQWAQEKAPNE